MKTVAIVQARVASTRLPAKVLLDLGGLTALERCLRRVAAIEGVSEVIVATSDQPHDELIVSLSRRLGFSSVRGSEHDVLARYAKAAAALGPGVDAVVRCTSDCPLLDPAISSQVVRQFAMMNVDYASNVLERRLPRGLDTEIFSVDALARAHREATHSADREHVTRYFYTNPNVFRLLSVADPNLPNLSHHRWTLDTLDDYRFLFEVFARLGTEAAHASIAQVRSIVEADPALYALNSHVEQKAH